MPRNPKKSWREQGYSFINNIYAGIALMVTCAIASILYTRYGQAWTAPIINGLVTGAVVLSLFLSVRAVLSLPTATEKTTSENVGAKVLTWLHKFGLTVRSFPEETTFDFFLTVTTEGGKVIGVKRNLTLFPDYIYVTGLITLTDAEKEVVKDLTALEVYEALFSIQQELWRGVFGFDARKFEESGLTMHIRIPITERLAETDVLDAIWRMEAILGNVMAIEGRTSILHAEAKKHMENSSEKESADGGSGGAEELRNIDVQIVPRPQISDASENNNADA
jgi:hypothetical protein